MLVTVRDKYYNLFNIINHAYYDKVKRQAYPSYLSYTLLIGIIHKLSGVFSLFKLTQKKYYTLVVIGFLVFSFNFYLNKS